MKSRTHSAHTIFPVMLAALIVRSFATLGEPTVLLAAEPQQESPPQAMWILHTDDTRAGAGSG